jgi:hypothetical protein
MQNVSRKFFKPKTQSKGATKKILRANKLKKEIEIIFLQVLTFINYKA